MKYTLLLFGVLWVGAVYAETQASDAAKPSAGSTEVLKKDFFDSKPEGKPKPADSRYSAGDADYNSEQREQWLKTCDKYKNKDLETYRKCFQDEKSKSKEALKQSFDSVEQKQSLPLRNVNPLLDEQRNQNGQDNE